MAWLQRHRWQLTKQRAAQKGCQAVLLPIFQEWALLSLGMQRAQSHWVSTAAAVSEHELKPFAGAHTEQGLSSWEAAAWLSTSQSGHLPVRMPAAWTGRRHTSTA